MWHDLKKAVPAKSGQYLVLIDSDPEVAFAQVEDYYKKGDIITVMSSDKEDPNERIHDFLFNDGLLLRAEMDGFYELSDDEFNATWDKTVNDNPNYPVYWSELPEPPKGRKWGCIKIEIEEEE